MGELPHFIKSVPEESIGKRPVSSEPARNNLFFDGFTTVSGVNVEVFRVPKGTVFEVTSVFLSCYSISAPAIAEFYLGWAESLGASGQDIMRILLDHNEHQVFGMTFAPLSVLIKEGNVIRMTQLNNGKSAYSVIGNLINISELQTKTNIII